MSKEPTRAQLSSRLSYQSKTPADDDEDDYDDEFEYDGSGRPPIPRRPAIPERPQDEPGSADEDDVDEKPQVVVLKEGKHLSEREAENERRRAKGLPPLPEPESKETASPKGVESGKETSTDETAKAAKSQGLSFSSGATGKGKGTKRKAVGDGREEGEKPGVSTKTSKKKTKKPEKKLLSFDEDA
ncbi:hypothetical protein C8Q80DRAFT_1218877 [Daedaleopsis nitida]|nr:hypothetical protein C8Q80DRAFT_1218877 [Daedaleopsis nitida]